MGTEPNAALAPQTDASIRRLMALGVVARWRCDDCNDFVPYRCLEMTETESRRKHRRKAKHGR